jgi:hypothetical protein
MVKAVRRTFMKLSPDSFAHNIAIKRYDFCQFLASDYWPMLSFLKSRSWLVIETHGSK